MINEIIFLALAMIGLISAEKYLLMFHSIEQFLFIEVSINISRYLTPSGKVSPVRLRRQVILLFPQHLSFVVAQFSLLPLDREEDFFRGFKDKK